MGIRVTRERTDIDLWNVAAVVVLVDPCERKRVKRDLVDPTGLAFGTGHGVFHHRRDVIREWTDQFIVGFLLGQIDPCNSV